MILTPHLLVGAAIASKISNPLLALPLAFLNHYFLDSLPHEEYSVENIWAKRWKKSLSDFMKIFLDILSGLFLVYLFSENQPMIYFGALFAVFPDGITLLSLILPPKKLITLHQKIHMTLNNIYNPENKKRPLFWGLASQATVIALAIFFLL